MLFPLVAIVTFPSTSTAHPLPTASSQLLSIRADASSSNAAAAPSWVAAPQQRGTWQLIIGCLTTLSLCAWTAYHPNRWMAGRLRGEVQRLGARAVDGLERVVEQSWDDQNAKSTSPFMRFSFEESSREEPHSAQSTRHSAQSASYASPDPFTPWTLQQSFFAVCGGLAVDTSSFWHTPLTTLTPRGLLALAHAGLLPNITNEQVSEKSKANAAAKVLVCIQASWFLVQAVARLAQKLPLTLLEVHVLTHVLCALAMYFCWVDKPYDAETPVVVTDEQVKDLVSLFVLDAGGTESVQDRLMRPISMDEIRQRHKPRQWIKDPSVKVPRFRFKLDWPSDQDDDDGESKEVFDEESIQVECEPPTSQELARMRDHHIRANRALDYLRNRYFQAVACRGDGEMPPEPQLYFEQSSSSAKCKYVVYERSNRKIEGGFGKSDSVFGRFDKAFSVVSALYGAMHLAAWNDHFPSAVECWMWRVGALCMVVAPPLWQATNLVDLLLNGTRVEPKEKWVRAAWLFWLAKVARWLLVALVAGPMLLVGYAALIGWSYGRLFMLVEGFISLRSPPVGTYEVLGWSNYWPHAG
ncbi:hypothetical protein HDK77DRAFT_427736 [Phyllosticta capitalensis]